MHIIPEDTAFFVGDVVYQKSGTFGPRRQQWFQTVFLHHGQATFASERHSFTLRAHQACFLLPGHTYRIAFSTREQTRHGWIDTLNFAPPPSLKERLLALPCVFTASERLFQLSSLALGVPQPLAGAAERLYHDLARAAFSEAFLQAGLEEVAAPLLPTPVTKAQAFLQGHFAESLELASIAHAAGVSRTHLIRLFKQHLHTTPVQRLWQVRLQEGCRLLQQTGLSVGEIAARCGFQTPYHFSRRVRRHTGLPPRAYRLRHWGSSPSP
ncbi:MAG: helix-turn-helix domain-containing protein [Opitutales bacterium]